MVSDSLRPPWTVAHQTPLSKVFSRQEWVAVSFSRVSSRHRDQIVAKVLTVSDNAVLILVLREPPLT